MKIQQYVVDAFTDHIFAGNPAAVCVMEQFLPDEMLQNIAIENNLSETAFVVPKGEGYQLRWFTPGREVDLCGHATLGTSFVLANFCAPAKQVFTFETLSGRLTVQRRDNLFEMDFPSRPPEPVAVTEAMVRAVGLTPQKAYLSRDLMLVLEDEQQVRNFQPDFAAISQVPEGMGLFITAPSREYDFVSRTFFPKIKVNEDPVCGSAHCNLIPYWSKRLGKKKMVAYQASPRGGVLYCEDAGERVKISGQAVLYAESVLHIEG